MKIISQKPRKYLRKEQIKPSPLSIQKIKKQSVISKIFYK